MFEIHDQSGRTAVGFFASIAHGAGESAVGVPALMVELDELAAAFGEAPGLQAVCGVGAGLLCFFAVEVPGGLWFVRHVGGLGNAGLHAIGHFVLRDAGLDFGIEFFVKCFFVEGIEFLEHRAS